MKTIVGIHRLPGNTYDTDFEIDTKTTTIDEALKIANLEVGKGEKIIILVRKKII